jgi:hypothetical protein
VDDQLQDIEKEIYRRHLSFGFCFFAVVCWRLYSPFSSRMRVVHTGTIYTRNLLLSQFLHPAVYLPLPIHTPVSLGGGGVRLRSHIKTSHWLERHTFYLDCCLPPLEVNKSDNCHERPGSSRSSASFFPFILRKLIRLTSRFVPCTNEVQQAVGTKSFTCRYVANIDLWHKL